jgi:hypothetical protein
VLTKDRLRICDTPRPAFDAGTTSRRYYAKR